MNIPQESIVNVFGRLPLSYKYEADANGLVVYEGVCVTGTPTSFAGWIVERHFYDVNNNVTDSKIQFGIKWDDRATIT